MAIVSARSGTSPSAIAATGLRKSFGAKVVLDGIDLTVARAARSSTADASICSAASVRRYPMGVLAMQSAPSRARARDTRICSALVGCSGCSSGHSASSNRDVLQPARGSSASRASRPPSRDPVISTPRKETRDSRDNSMVTGSRLIGLPHARPARATCHPARWLVIRCNRLRSGGSRPRCRHHRHGGRRRA